MTREFVLTKVFEANWSTLGLTDVDLMNLQQVLLLDPQKGVLIQNTGGLRKIRIPLNRRGKSAGARVIYVDFVAFEKIYLIAAYSKSQKADLTNKERSEIRMLINSLEIELLRREK